MFILIHIILRGKCRNFHSEQFHLKSILWVHVDFLCFLLLSGFIGSGLAVFSRHRIHDAFLYRYSLNGYPYMVSVISLHLPVGLLQTLFFTSTALKRL